MALIRLSSLIGSISGSLGAITFRNTRNGPLATKRLTRTKQRSPAQQASDSRWVTLIRSWKDLSPENRLAWSVLAKQIPYTNALGVTYPRSAFALYTQHASPAYLSGLTLPTTPPVYPPLPALTDAVLDFHWLPGYRVWFTVSGSLTPVYALLYGSRPAAVPTIYYRSPSSFPPPYIFKSWRFIQITSVTTGINMIDVRSIFQSTFGTPQATEPVAIRAFLWHPDALASPKSFLSTFTDPL